MVASPLPILLLSQSGEVEIVDSTSNDLRVVQQSEEMARTANVSGYDRYRELYERSVRDPDGFWGELAEKELDWFEKWDRVSYEDTDKHIYRWFDGGRLNASDNCLDRHVARGLGEKTALIWEPDSADTQPSTYTYEELLEEVCEFANVLKSYDVGKGDRVCIYLPMVPALPIAMLACARIGAIHSVVFGGFSAQALRQRLVDSQAKVLVTADGSFRAGKTIRMKDNADEALDGLEDVKAVIVVRRTGSKVEMRDGRDRWWHEEMTKSTITAECKCEVMDAEDPIFLLYTSGSTGRPKGVVHATAGYMLYAKLTHKWVFDIKDDDVWWCSADIGWITGHTYIVYGPLSNGATSVMFEGVPTYPEPDRFWQVCEKYKVTSFYTAPTVIRALMRLGDKWTQTRDLSSLRVLGTVGEPINPDVWLWYYDKIGGGRCPVLDTWWQTETGGIMIAPLAGATPMKPGSASLPFPGIVPAVFKDDGTEAGVNEPGYLVIKNNWPSLLRTVWQDHERYIETYWSQFPGVYLTGDGCSVDEDGFYWIRGRIDDVINVSGHRIGTAEVESAAVSHGAVAEAAVVGFPHRIKGQGIYIFATLKQEFEGKYDTEEKIAHEVSGRVREVIGAFAAPDIIQFTPSLPKTRSGKIMRRILRKIVEGKTDEFGDTSTLADAEVLRELIAGATKALKDFDYDAHLQVILTGYPYECKGEQDKLVGAVCVHSFSE